MNEVGVDDSHTNNFQDIYILRQRVQVLRIIYLLKYNTHLPRCVPLT